MKISRRRGVAAVEFALVLPVIVLVLFGVLELACMIHVQGALLNAAREGARHGITRSATADSVTKICRQSLSHTSVKGVSISVTPEPSGAEPGTLIQVQASADYRLNSWLPGSGFLNGAQLSSKVVMRKE